MRHLHLSHRIQWTDSLSRLDREFFETLAHRLRKAEYGDENTEHADTGGSKFRAG
jgi:hypothetical protein